MTPAMAERLREFTENHPQHATIFLGVTVYLLEGSTVRSHCQVWGQNNGEAVSFWSSGDFTLLSGVGEFTRADGGTCSLFLLSSVIDVARWAREDNAETFNLPEIPMLPEGEPAYVVNEGTPDVELRAALTSLHEILRDDEDKLRIARDDRERAYRERKAIEKASPRPPKDIILNHWKIDRKEGGTK